MTRGCSVKRCVLGVVAATSDICAHRHLWSVLQHVYRHFPCRVFFFSCRLIHHVCSRFFCFFLLEIPSALPGSTSSVFQRSLRLCPTHRLLRFRSTASITLRLSTLDLAAIMHLPHAPMPPTRTRMQPHTQPRTNPLPTTRRTLPKWTLVSVALLGFFFRCPWLFYFFSYLQRSPPHSPNAPLLASRAPPPSPWRPLFSRCAPCYTVGDDAWRCAS